LKPEYQAVLVEYAKRKFYRVGRGRERKILSPFCFSLKTWVENDVRRNPQRGSFVWLEKVGSIIGGYSSDNGNGSKNARFFRGCRDYVNPVKMSTDVLLIKPIITF